MINEAKFKPDLSDRSDSDLHIGLRPRFKEGKSYLV